MGKIFIFKRVFINLTYSLFFFISSNFYGAVYDCFPFFNELELLEIRLHELNDVVDYFVLVEAKESFTGFEKPLYFEENKARFNKFEDKIIHLVIDAFPNLPMDPEKAHWARERYTRDYIKKGLNNCSDSDVIFISDLDEIPRSSAVLQVQSYLKPLESLSKRNARKNAYVCNLEMRLFSLSMNREYSIPWSGGCKAAPFWFFKNLSPWEFKVYHQKHSDLHMIKNAGWHFNSMGGDQRVLAKWLNVGPLFNNQPFFDKLSEDDELLKTVVQSHRDAHTKTVEIDDSYPKYFVENLDYYKSIGWIWELD